MLRDAITIKSSLLIICFCVGIVIGFRHKEYRVPPIPASQTIKNAVEAYVEQEAEIMENVRIPIENSRGGYTIVKAKEAKYKYGFPFALTGVTVKSYSATSDIPYSEFSSDHGVIDIVDLVVRDSHFWGNLKYKNKDIFNVVNRQSD